MITINFQRVRVDDVSLGMALFSLMSSVFDEPLCDHSAAYVEKLLRREDCWAIAAIEDRAPAGGLTAFTLPMTRSQLDELLIYDLAVLPTHQRRGIGRPSGFSAEAATVLGAENEPQPLSLPPRPYSAAALLAAGAAGAGAAADAFGVGPAAGAAGAFFATGFLGFGFAAAAGVSSPQLKSEDNGALSLTLPL